MILTDPSGNLPCIIGVALIGMIGGAIAGALTEAIKSYAKKKDILWKEVGKSAIKGAAIRGAVAITGGVTLSYAATDSAVASTGAAMSGLGLGVAASMGAGGASGLTGFQWAQQWLQAQATKNVGSTNDFYLDGGNGKGIVASINENGVVKFAIETGKNSAITGREMFSQMMQHFGSNVKAIMKKK